MSAINTETGNGVMPSSGQYPALPVYGWRDQVVDITPKGNGANNPSWATFINGINAYSFSASVMNEVWTTIHIQHDYALGTPVYIHVHWSTTGTNAGVVRWGFEYTAAKGHQQQAFPATTTIYKEQNAQGVANYHMIAEISDANAVPSTNLQPDTLILCRLFRDAANGADTCTDAAFVFTCDAHFQVNGYSTPNKVPNFYA